jgi:phosphopantetheine adenylyltransferase
MYEGLAASRNRLSKKVVSLQRRAEVLERQVAERDEALVDAFDCLTRALCEYENLVKLSQAAAAGVQFGVDQQDALQKLLALQERIEFMHEVCLGVVKITCTYKD